MTMPDPDYVIMRPDGSGWHLPRHAVAGQRFEGIRQYDLNCKARHLLGFVTAYSGLKLWPAEEVRGGCPECLANHASGHVRVTRVLRTSVPQCKECERPAGRRSGLCPRHYLQQRRIRRRKAGLA